MARRYNVPSPNHSARRGTAPVQLIVLHHTATAPNTGAAVARYFQNPAAQVSAHEVVDTNGDRYHCVDWSRRAWHAGSGSWRGHTDTNSISLGIEIVNRGNRKDPWPDVQLRTVARLIRQMRAKYPTIARENIVDHEMVSSAGKVDLRGDFPAGRLMWMVLHPYASRVSPNPYGRLPRWARRVADRIRKE